MKVDMGAKGSYDVWSEQQITKMFKPQLIKHKLLLICIRAIVKFVANGLTTIEYTYRLVDTEMPFGAEGSFIDIDTVGQGKSTGDKGAGMASTYGYKGIFIRLFALVSGLDADNKSDFHHDQEAEKLINDHRALMQKLEDLHRGGKLKSLDNYNRIKAAISLSKGSSSKIDGGMQALEAILSGQRDPDTVSVKR